MGMPFVFGKIAENQDFIGREKEVSTLSANFVYQKNTVVLSSRGWGKSTLLRKASSTARSRDYQLRICMISLDGVNTVEGFFAKYVEAIVKATSKTLEEAVSGVRKYLQGTSAMTGADAMSLDEFSLSFDSSALTSVMDNLIDLPELIAKDKNLKVVVCIDDFHYVSNLADYAEFMSRLDLHWSNHKGASYCICYDTNELLNHEVKRMKTFSESGTMIYLDKIPSSAFVSYIRNSFADTGKYIDDEAANLLVNLVENHPHYVLQLAQLSWLRTSVVCPNETIREAHSAIADQMSLVFKTLTESLTWQQMCYLKAILNGETVISTSDVLHRYGISSATSASRSKAALIARNIIAVKEGKVIFLDPIYSYWLKTRYFK